MDGVNRDLIYAVRSLWSAKKFAAIVIATLALGIGANTAVFGVLYAVVLQPLPYAAPERLVRIQHLRAGEPGFFPGPAITAFREQSQTLDVAVVYIYRAEGVDLTDRAQPERVRALPVSADYFRVLGVEPVVGHLFTRADERRTPGVAVISERLWREYLGGATDVEGRTIALNGVPHRVVAVLPAGFDDPLQPGVDVWSPVDMVRASGDAWDNNYLSAIGRLRGAATLSEAQAEATTIAARLQVNYRNDVPRTVRLTPLQADIVGNAGRTLWVLFGAVGLLLVIACVNVAGVVLARGAARESELAVRAALGCSRWRLARQLVLESVVLSLAGGVAGVLLAYAVGRALLAAAPELIARTGAAPWNRLVFVFGFGVALVAGIAFGLAPALQFARPNLEGVLRASSRGATSGRRHVSFRNALVVCQIALALVLLTGAGLLFRSFQRLSAVDLGLRSEQVVTFEVHLPAGRYSDPTRRADFHVELERRISSLPGVRAAGAVSRLPVTGSYHSWGTRRPDGPADQRTTQAEQRVIEGAYFDAMGIPLLRGRTFGAEDRAKTPRDVVVSQELVRQMFGADDPLGRQLRAGGETLDIIGVVGDVPIATRGGRVPTVYHSHRQFAGDRNWALTQVVAVQRSTPTLLADVRRELAALDPGLVLYQPRLLTDVIGRGIAQERFALLVIGSYALLALALAAVGIYGVLSYAVSRRRREMGIRLALGSQTSAVRRLIVQDGGRLAIAGVTLGLVAAAVGTRALGSLLFDVSTTDPAIFAAAAATLVVVALAASWMPARAATRVDPIASLRADA